MTNAKTLMPKFNAKRKEPEKGGEKPIISIPYKNWDAKTDAFHIDQAKLRSEIRIKEHREKFVDSFAKIWMIFDRSIKVPEDFCQNQEYRESYKILERVPLGEFKELYNDIEMHGKFRTDIDYANYWNSLRVSSVNGAFTNVQVTH